MQISWQGNKQFIKFQGRTFTHCEDAIEAVRNVEWAQKILNSPAITFQNGKNSHAVANEVLDSAEDKLIDYQLVTA